MGAINPVMTSGDIFSHHESAARGEGVFRDDVQIV